MMRIVKKYFTLIIVLLGLCCMTWVAFAYTDDSDRAAKLLVDNGIFNYSYPYGKVLGYKTEIQGQGHTGIDVFGPSGGYVDSGAVIRWPFKEDGSVVAHWASFGTSSVVTTTINKTTYTMVFAHMNNNYTSAAKKTILKHGDPIGTIGRTGQANGVFHLHFEIREGGLSNWSNKKLVNPVSFIKQYVSEGSVSPQISSVSLDKTIYATGEYANITVKVTGDAQQAFVRTETNEEFAHTTKYITSGNTRLFVIKWELGKSGNRTVAVGVKGANGTKVYKNFAINIVNPVKFSSVLLNKSSYTIGEFAQITVKVTGDATQAFIRTETNEEFAHTTKYTTSGNTRTFTISWELGKAGNRTVYVGVKGMDGKKIYKSFSINIKAVTPPKITSIVKNKTSYTVGEYAQITVRTTGNATQAFIRTETGEEFAHTTKYTTSGTTRIFTISWELGKAGNRTVSVGIKGTDGKKTYKSFFISIKALPSLKITSIAKNKTSYSVGEYAQITVKTTGNATQAFIRTETNEEFAHTTKYTTSGDTRTFTISWELGKSGNRTVSVGIKNASGQTMYSSMSINIVATFKITSIAKNKTSYTVGEYAQITVKTTGNATQAFIRTETGEEFAHTTKYTTSGDTRTFTISWELGKSGNRTVSVGIRNSSGQTTYSSMGINIR